MADYHGYDGGDSEESLVAALRELLDLEEGDTVAKIKGQYWKTGHIIEIAVAKGYTKREGLKGWFYHRFRKSETHARDCLKAWQCRKDFDRALEWYRTGNTGFTPKKLSGPRFCIEIVEAWRDRLKPPKKQAAPRPGIKELRALLVTYRSSLDRLRGEHLAWAAQDERESRVLTTIDKEIAEAEIEAGFGDDEYDPALPIHATRDDEDTSGGKEDTQNNEAPNNTEPDTAEDTQIDDNTDAGKSDPPPEHTPGVVDFHEVQDALARQRKMVDAFVTEPEHTSGAGKKHDFVVVDKVVPAPKRPRQRPIAPRRLRLVSNNPPPKKKRGRPVGSKNKPKGA